MKSASVEVLTTDALSRIAPEEAFLVDYYDPRSQGQGATSRGPQGFGAGEAVTLLLPFVYAFFSKFVEALGTEAGKKSFAVIADWAGGREAGEAAAHEKIAHVLRESGLPDAAVQRTAGSIMTTLKKFG